MFYKIYIKLNENYYREMDKMVLKVVIGNSINFILL